MNRRFVVLSLLIFAVGTAALAQSTPSDTLLAMKTVAAVDTPHFVNPFEVIITATRQEIPLRQARASTFHPATPLLRKERSA